MAMRSPFKLAITFSLLVAAGCPPEPSKADPKLVYGTICAKCHAADGKGEPAIRVERANLPDFTTPEFQARYGVAEIKKAIQLGNPDKGMPQFRDFTPAQLDELAAHVKSFGGAAP